MDTVSCFVALLGLPCSSEREKQKERKTGASALRREFVTHASISSCGLPSSPMFAS